jgi:succinyldiaminopimelate transaminase
MSSPRKPVAANLPDFPWDLLLPAKQKALAYPGGIIDLSVGTPVDDVPQSAQAALAAASNSPGYPVTQGSPAFREAVAQWLMEECSVLHCPADSVLPTLGLKEAVAWLPFLLGLTSEHTVVVPALAYPTYEVGARLVGARVLRCDDHTQWQDDPSVAFVWLNSPSNPTGRVMTASQMKAIVNVARERNIIVASDECYLELWWTEHRPVSVLSDEVSGGDFGQLLALHSLSKRSNLAGYRIGSITGDAALIGELLSARKHLGHIVPAPTLAAAVAAYGDRTSANEQRERYRNRRTALINALNAAGFHVDDSAGSLFIWATTGEDCWDTVNRLAEIGILVAPGTFYGPTGSRHIRIALTAKDEAVAEACERLRVFAH